MSIFLYIFGNIPVTLATTRPILIMLLEVLYLHILRVSLNCYIHQYDLDESFCKMAHWSPWHRTDEPPIGVQSAITFNIEIENH